MEKDQLAGDFTKLQEKVNRARSRDLLIGFVIGAVYGGIIIGVVKGATK